MMVVRVCVVLLGLLIGAGVYSCGMFHTVRPTLSDFTRAANCGYPSAATAEHNISTEPVVADSASTLCYIAPGEWIKSPYGNTPFFFAIVIAFGSVSVALTRSAFFVWATRSAGRFVVSSVLLWGTPMTLLGLQENFVEGTLTPDWAVHVVIYSELIAAVGGVFVWYVVVRSLIFRRSGR